MLCQFIILFHRMFIIIFNEYQIKKLQRVMNASARLVYRAPMYCHITPLLRELHWLPVRLRVDFKILLVTF